MVTTIENVTIEQIVTLSEYAQKVHDYHLGQNCLAALNPCVDDHVEFEGGEDHNTGRIVSIKGDVRGGWYVEVTWETLVKTSQYWEVVPTEATYECVEALNNLSPQE